MNVAGFHQFRLSLEPTVFDELSQSVVFEDITKGRKGNHLVKVEEAGIPLVRTTTKYNIPAHNFDQLHNSIATAVGREAEKFPDLANADFNNALIEVYDRDYIKMKYHSDQCLDIDKNSCIALFSCYEKPDDLNKYTLRKLKVKDKISGEEMDIILENNSVVIFSLETNRKFQHKIVLEYPKPSEPDNRWLGMTFRRSATLIRFEGDQPVFPDGSPLTLADETERKSFYRLRGEENKGMDFEYPEMNYTLSMADLLLPKGI